MFPEAIKIHQIDTRKPEKYQVQHANTERLNKSAVIYMQNLLNETQIFPELILWSCQTSQTLIQTLNENKKQIKTEIDPTVCFACEQ